MPPDKSVESVPPWPSEAMGSGETDSIRDSAGLGSMVSCGLARLGSPHSTVGETWWVCSKAFRDFSIAQTPSPLTPIVSNPAFSPGLQDSRFQNLKAMRSFQARHSIVNGHWLTRQQIMDVPMFAGLSFWQKLQLSHFLGALPFPDSFR